MSEQDLPGQDTLNETIAAFERMSVPDRPSDADVLARLDACQDGRTPSVFSSTALSKGGYRLRLVVGSAAAVVLVIGGLGFLFFNGTAPIALAEVVEAAQKHKLVRYQELQSTEAKGHLPRPVYSIVYADLTASRFRSESLINHPDGQAIRLSVQNAGRHLITDSRRKTAWLGPAPNGYKSVLCCLEEFQKKEGVTQVQEQLGTRTTIKYHRQTTTLWIDPATKLPIRMVQDVINPGFEVASNRLVWSDFAWDPEVPSGFRNLNDLFSTRPPEGYMLDDQTKEKKDP